MVRRHLNGPVHHARITASSLSNACKQSDPRPRHMAEASHLGHRAARGTFVVA
jgi:hypothetical protein